MKVLCNLAITALLTAVFIGLSFSLFKLEVSDTGIILTFVGILATFIVIGNYTQVKDIEEKTLSEIKKLKNEHIDKIEDISKNTAIQTIRKLLAEPNTIIDVKEPDALSLFKLANKATDLDVRLSYLESAINSKDAEKDADLLKKIVIIKSATEEAIKRRDAEFDRDF